MSVSGSTNPRLPPLLRIIIWGVCAAVFAAAVALFFAPVSTNRIWAWAVPPFNARYVGAVYFAAFLPLLVMALRGRWSPGRMILWMIFLFTSLIMVVMVIHRSAFEWSRPVTWAFWFAYLFFPIASALFLLRFRSWSAAEPPTMPSGQAVLLSVIGLALGIYGLALLAIPLEATGFWPWPVDPFHARIYAATFVTPAAGAWLIRKYPGRWEHITLGLSLATLGLFSIVGTVWTSATVPPERQVDYAALGTIVFMAMNAALVALGGALALVGNRLRHA